MLYPDGVGSSINSIYCQSEGDCLAVGYFAPGNGSISPLEYYQEVNGSWSVQRFPNSDDVSEGQLNDIWCANLSNCVAVGEFSPPSNSHEDLFLIEIERNGKWATRSLEPRDSDRMDDVYDSVRCTNINNCVAQGTFQSSPKSKFLNFCGDLSHGRISKGEIQAYADDEICNLKHASLGYDQTTPTTLACPRTSWTGCLLSTRTRLFQYRAHAWRALRVGLLGFKGFVRTGVVACSAEGLCASDGSYFDSQVNQTRAFLTVGYNGRWSNITIEPPDFGGNADPYEVSNPACVGTALCIATSGYSPPLGNGATASTTTVRTAITVFDGGRVTTVDIPMREFFFSSSISCPSTNACTLVGSYLPTGYLKGGAESVIVTLTRDK